MRIVGGTLKGRTLLPFDRIGIRPTSDMARESIFNILRDKIAGASFLDLFAGTGAMGIEALSRGAKAVTLVDSGRESVKLINKNLEKLKITDFIKVEFSDALRYLALTRETFDVIYIDPPYDSDLGEKSLLSVTRVMADDAIVIYESEKPIEKDFSGLIKYDERKYGRARLSFFKKGE